MESNLGFHIAAAHVGLAQVVPHGIGGDSVLGGDQGLAQRMSTSSGPVERLATLSAQYTAPYTWPTL